MSNQLLTEVTANNRLRWGRMGKLPFSRVHAYRLIEAGILSSVLLKLPGSKKSIRLVDLDSLDRYLEKLAAEEKEAVK
jgi:hypothetical protein